MFFISKCGGGLGYAGYSFHISGLRSRASLTWPPHHHLPPAAPLGADFLTPLTNRSGIRSSRCPVRAEGITMCLDSRRANMTARSGRGEFWGHVASWRPDSESRMGTPRDARRGRASDAWGQSREEAGRRCPAAGRGQGEVQGSRRFVELLAGTCQGKQGRGPRERSAVCASRGEGLPSRSALGRLGWFWVKWIQG